MMDRLKEEWAKVMELFKKVSKKVWTIMAVGIVLIAAVITVVLNNKPYSVLFTGLSGEEASAIMAYLDEQGASDYRLENNDTVLVPKSQETSLKAQLLMQGYPKSGFSYSVYYDNVSALSTESERNTAYLMALQDRMGAVIGSLDGVKDAKVTIAQGEDRSYVLDSGNVIEASAAVLVTMKNGQKLSNEQANAIRNLVARGVKGLGINSVSIVDSLGNVYNAGDGSGGSGDASDLKLRLEEENNNKIRTSIMQVLVPLFGEENVRVGVNCTVDVSHSIENATDVKLPDWASDGSTNGEGIIGSKVYDHAIVRDGESTVGGVVGTESNSDLSTYVERGTNPDGTELQIITSGQVDYDNSKSQTQTERTAGYITDCTVSVSINSTTAGLVDIASIRSHVARAAGIDAGVSITEAEAEYLARKISVLALPFYAAPTGTPTPTLPDGTEIEMWIIYAAAGGVLLFVLLVLIILMSRSRRKKKLALAERRNIEELFAAAGMAEGETIGANVMSLQTERGMELRKMIRQFADENPEIAAQMLRAWMRGGEENG